MNERKPSLEDVLRKYDFSDEERVYEVTTLLSMLNNSKLETLADAKYFFDTLKLCTSLASGIKGPSSQITHLLNTITSCASLAVAMKDASLKYNGDDDD